MVELRLAWLLFSAYLLDTPTVVGPSKIDRDVVLGSLISPKRVMLRQVAFKSSVQTGA